jgi:hypothetical protein
MRVLTAPGTFSGNGTTFNDPGSNGILGGDDDPNVTVDDFNHTFTIEDDRVVGTVSGLMDTNGPMTPTAVNFPSVFQISQCADGICAVIDASIRQGSQTQTYVGLAVLRKDFVAYHVVNLPDGSPNDHSEPILAFGGKGYDFGTRTGKTYAFVLTPDVLQGDGVQLEGGAIGPFASAESSPFVDASLDEDGNPKPLPSVSPLLYLERDSNPESKAVWLQSSLYVNTTPADSEGDGFDQQSFVNVALGGVQNDGLVGARRGGSHVDVVSHRGCEPLCGPEIKRESFAFTGDIATSPAQTGRISSARTSQTS